MIKSTIRNYSTQTSLKTNGFGGIQSILANSMNQSVQFSKPELVGNTMIFKHSIEQLPFQPNKINKKKVHNFKGEEVQDMIKLRVQDKMPLSKIAEKYKTQPKVVSSLTKSDPAVLQIQVDNLRVKGPKVQESAEAKKQRLENWVKKNQQREYDLKVIKAAESHERLIRQRRDVNESNSLAHQESYDMTLKSQAKDDYKVQEKYLTLDEKKAKAKMLANLRRRKVVDSSEKKQELVQRSKNKAIKNNKK